MFSSRLPASLEENRISRAVARARAEGRSVIDLTESNPTRVGLRYPEAAILAALADPAALTYEPAPRGLEAARRAVAAYYARLGARVDPERVLLTASTSEGYALLFKLLCDPGDVVLAPQPSYPLFELLAGLEGVTVRPYPLRYHAGWHLDAGEVRPLVDERVRAILTVSPHNPTGHVLAGDERDALVGLCAERGLALVCDEVFADYATEGAPTCVEERRALTFCLSGLSKPCGLPQVKLGWIHTSGPEALVAEAEARLELIADSYLSVSAPAQHAAPRLLALADDVGAQLAARVRENRAHLAERVRGTALTLLPSGGGWSAVVRLPRTRSEEAWVLGLLDAGVLVHPGFFYDFPDEAYVVVSLIVPPAQLARGLDRVMDYTARL